MSFFQLASLCATCNCKMIFEKVEDCSYQRRGQSGSVEMKEYNFDNANAQPMRMPLSNVIFLVYFINVYVI